MLRFHRGLCQEFIILILLLDEIMLFLYKNPAISLRSDSLKIDEEAHSLIRNLLARNLSLSVRLSHH
jgi:hypothetical protein